MPALKQLTRFILRWGVPEGLADLLRRYRHKPRTPRSGLEHIIIARNTELAGRHAGQRCFILATGPSVTSQDLSFLAGELCIAVSHFALHPDIRRIDPAYHVVAPYHPPFDFDDADKLFDSFERYDPDRVTYIFGHRPYAYSLWNYLQRRPDRQPRNTYWLDYTASEQLDDVNCADADIWDLTARPFEPRTVIYSAIQVAAFMGVSEIYLVGCDHDYLADITRVTNHHFYRDEDGVSDADHLSGFTTERWFKEYYLRWKQYRLMRQHLENCGVKIYNATAGGMLDVFERVDPGRTPAGAGNRPMIHAR